MPVVVRIGVVVALLNCPQVLWQLVLNQVEVLDQALPLHMISSI